MEKWLLTQATRIDACVMAHLPATWPTLGTAYKRASNGKIAVETLLGLLSYRPGKQLSDDTILVFAAVQSAALGMRMIQSAHNGIDADGWIGQWGPALTQNYGHGLGLVATSMIEHSGLPSGQKHSLRSLLDDSITTFLSAQDALLEGIWLEPGDFEGMISMSWGTLCGLGPAAATILRMGTGMQLKSSLALGLCIGHALYRLHLNRQLKQTTISETVWLWALRHSLEFAHAHHGLLATYVASPQATWDYEKLAAVWKEISLDEFLLQSTSLWIEQAVLLANDLPEHHDLIHFLSALVPTPR
jgi:hypothetical protein